MTRPDALPDFDGNPMTRKRPMDRNSALQVVQIVQAEQQETAAPAPTVQPEKPRSTKERVNKAVMDLVLAEGLELSADDEAKRGALTTARFQRRDAQKLRDKAGNDLTRWNHTTANVQPRGNGGELSPLPEPAHPLRRDYIKQQVQEDKGVLRHMASSEAMGLLCDVDALTLGLELADDLKCKTRAEKMLAHQAAAFHAASMKFLQRAGAERDRASSVTSRGGISQAACVESARMLNAAARAAGACGEAIERIKKLKTGGKQVVQVQHVVVKDGGQAVVAQNLRKTGGGKRKAVAKSPKRLALPGPRGRRG
jgi:hypothetical protein